MIKIPRVILWIENSREYGRQLLRGISKYASLYGPWNFCTAQPFYYEKADNQNKVLSLIKKWDADGVIMRETPDVEQIKKLGIPAVISTYMSEKIPGMTTVVGDCKGAGIMAAEHLLERGFKKFAYCGLDNMYWSHERRASFQERLSQYGCSVEVYKQPNTKTNEQAFLVEWLKKLPKPIGLMTCTDDRSQDIVEACKLAGIHIPEEIAVIGVDNDELICGLSNPPLSSVALNATKAGYEAAEALDHLMKGGKNEERVIVASATHIASRQSTDIMAIDDAEVASAIRYIRQNSKKIIQIGDVVEITSLSQRALQQRFRKILGRTIHDEIKRARIDMICKMLLNTKKTVSQIAFELGFFGDDHIARYFKKEKGMSPKEYRKVYGQDWA